MKRPLRHITTCLALGVAAAAFAALCWLAPTDGYSESERRPLTSAPEATIEALNSGDFAEDFETYAQDAFPFRDSFRTLKALAQLFVFHEADNNGLYVVLDEGETPVASEPEAASAHEDGETPANPAPASAPVASDAPKLPGIPAHLVKMEYPLDQLSVERATARFHLIYELYLAESDARVFNCVIPDKNYYFAETTGHLALDYDALFAAVASDMPYATPIDITAELGASSYYRTDAHWRQEALPNVAQALMEAMGAQHGEASYEITYASEPFYGAYYGQAALPVSPDQLAYLNNNVTAQATAFDYEHDRIIPLYDTNLEVTSGRDLYETFLGGSLSLVSVENPAATTDRELIIFRDSFASSLTPLMLEGYAKVTLIDLRYIQPQVIGQFVDFTNQDVLFLHSVTTLNSSQF